ncbi:hypothetical protein GGR54DRAFT_607111, partial [Hypoxylon sp. NC1633]
MPPSRLSAGDKDVKDLYIHEVDRTPEYEEFIKKVSAFYQKRGVSFDPEPRLPTMHGHITVDLLKLYKAVIKNGGYDELNKVQKSWGALATELGMHHVDNKAQGQLSFALKHDFYRYLGAYWIKDQYGREPPRKEILEDQTCATKNGPLLTRTDENFKLPSSRSSIETPGRDDRQADGTPISGSRANGRLREAPPQRVPFQPETGPSRQPRQASSQHATPAASTNANTSHASQHTHAQPAPHQILPHHDPNNPLYVIRNQQMALQRGSASFSSAPVDSETGSRLTEVFVPRQVHAALRPVNTPGNNPVEFGRRQHQLRMAHGVRDNQPPHRPVIPGVQGEGPNIYLRCLQALRSGIHPEQAFALNHLVRISFERGDKYKFETFIGLAEGLIEKALEIGSLFYHVEWQIIYTNEPDDNIAKLDGYNGTSDILERISKLTSRTILEHMQPQGFSNSFRLITEAVLTIRNMVMLVDNAMYLSHIFPVKDMLCIILHLPKLEMLVEIKHFALDIAEQLTPWLVLESDDPLYRTLLSQLVSTDRGTILTSLRAVSRISMNLETTNKLENVPAVALKNIMDWLLLNDEELVDSCLDFLYQYTAVVANVESLLTTVNMEHGVPHLVRLLGHGAKRVKEERVLKPERKSPATEEVVPLPADLRELMLKSDEPQRCYLWLRSLFEEDPDSHITQIAIWHAYTAAFGLPGTGRGTLTAADFIRNVSHVFVNARAQIIRHRNADGSDLFIIEGIRARTVPIQPDGWREEYTKCRWAVSEGPFTKTCNQHFLGSSNVWNHIISDHLGIAVSEDGKVAEQDVDHSCNWQDCTKYSKPTPMKLTQFMSHVKTHIPTTGQKRNLIEGQEPPAKRQRKGFVVPAKTMSFTWEQTLVTVDEKTGAEQAGGIPLSAVLVLRNIARNVVKTDSQEELLKKHEKGGEGGGWNEILFRTVMPRLFEVMTENKALADYITSLLQLVQQD